ncbi:hypothetical protein MHM88_05830 [Epibacterium sp. MM17-32]|uniref:hypothetical protein n=1 Tax=Epibacterium sp. MM17-32 TaxID=2917734 RepID=UPI001EF41766|nr:hypothetical protein [Epibacterium sp. MM17-32]MCG7627318.1 hypothetical protein [Epibacterium sp. MM17-32]
MPPNRTAQAKPIDLIASAEDYFRGSRCLSDARVSFFRSCGQSTEFYELPHVLRYHRACFMLEAFSLELFLKGVHAAREQGVFPTGHNLKTLFDNLSGADRASIEYIYDNAPRFQKEFREQQRLRGVPSDFHTQLKASASAFAHNRYSFEESRPDMCWVGSDILLSTRIFIFQEFPALTDSLQIGVVRKEDYVDPREGKHVFLSCNEEEPHKLKRDK